MDLIRIAIERPVAVIAAVLMAVMFGVVAMNTIPIQLAPDVRKPIINISTDWFGAAPAEIEREIINEQEEVLQGLENLEKMTASARSNSGEVTLEFAIGTDMSRALLLTANRLDRVGSYPEEANEPELSTSASEDNPIAWFRIFPAEGNDRSIHEYGDFVEDVVQERFKRVPGVADVNVFGGGPRELHVTVDPELMAQYGLTVPDVADTMRRANASVTGGDVEEGKRRYVVRTENDFTRPEQVAEVVLRSWSDPETGRVSRVTVGDIGTVEFGYRAATASIRANGDDAIAMNATREAGANVIEVMKGVREAVEELNAFELPRAQLEMVQVYDETIYINSAIDLVIQNIWVGGVLAAVILMVFLRSVRATLVIALAIPVSVIASFVAMAALGRSLNVVSLAGIAFAVGMVVDAAIVVLENIYRLRQSGMPTARAAYEGARQVWGAIFVSALTTVMVFIPILIMEQEIGQLFRDIAVAISVSVLLSLLVSVTVIPALSNWLLASQGVKGAKKVADYFPFNIIALVYNRTLGAVFGAFGRAFHRTVVGLTKAVVASRALALAIVVSVTAAASFVSYTMLPEEEYLPDGNRNLVFGVLFPPPGYNLETMRRIALEVEGRVKPLFATESGPEPDAEGRPKFENFFFVATQSRTFMGASAVDPLRAGDLTPVLQQALFGEPGTFGFFRQTSLFGRGVGGSRSVDIDISGPELEPVIGVAQQAFGMIGQLFPRNEGNQIRPLPALTLGSPEVRVEPDPVALSDNGLSARDLGLTVDAFNDGLRVDELNIDNGLIDLMLRGPELNVTETQGIGALPVVTRSGTIVPVDSLADVKVTAGPTQIRHVERKRTVTLQVSPSGDIALGTAIRTLQAEVLDKLDAQGLPPGVTMRLSGTADKLDEAKEVMQLDLIIALIIVFLVMAVLFESFLYPIIIMVSVPLAAAGGVLGLNYLPGEGHKLDTLTMLGFVILVGIVVNNAILIVHQTLFHVRSEAMAAKDAIVEATSNRVRPIFMSTLTSVFGMLPLVLFPGAGSEIYKGLGSVVVGGLALSAVLTLAIIPPLMSLISALIDRERGTAGAVMADAPDQTVPVGGPAE
ncbi:MAG: efflux RND transporter permease subunit [Alphaproteobacteria bacterium]|nr:efflux RND transporter permease subunit [Alphaproteobacteria bacterium]